MDLGLKGKSLQSVVIEYTLGIQLSDGHFLVVESPLSVDTHGARVLLSPEEDADEAFGPIRQLVGQLVEEAAADDAGALHVRFSDGTRLQVPPDAAYEAWSISGPNGTLVVCTPGGELATWSGSPES